MLVVVGGDGEGLLHETVRLVAVAIRATIGVLFVASLGGVTAGILVEAAAAATAFALHLAVGEKAARNPTGTPRFAVGPSAHASFALVPDKD